MFLLWDQSINQLPDENRMNDNLFCNVVPFSLCFMLVTLIDLLNWLFDCWVYDWKYDFLIILCRHDVCFGVDATGISFQNTVFWSLRYLQEVHASRNSSSWSENVLQGTTHSCLAQQVLLFYFILLIIIIILLFRNSGWSSVLLYSLGKILLELDRFCYCSKPMFVLDSSRRCSKLSDWTRTILSSEWRKSFSVQESSRSSIRSWDQTRRILRSWSRRWRSGWFARGGGRFNGALFPSSSVCTQCEFLTDN